MSTNKRVQLPKDLARGQDEHDGGQSSGPIPEFRLFGEAARKTWRSSLGRTGLIAGVGAIDGEDAIVAGRCQHGAVGRKLQLADSVPLIGQGQQFPSRCGLPQLHFLVEPGRS